MPCGNTSYMPAPDVLSPLLGPTAKRTQKYADWRVVSAHCLCANGLSFDIIVGEGSQCWPDSDTGPWSHVEVAGLNRALTSLDRYRHTSGDGTMGITRHHKVPLEDLNRLIARNGGLI